MKAFIRISMVFLGCVTALSLGLAPRTASAQIGYLGPGSTYGGDLARGQGVFLMGAGQYNLSTAMATSINADTAIRVNQYIFLSAMESKRRYHALMEWRQDNNNAQWAKLAQRRREAPTSSDLMSGNALNQVLKDLLEHATVNPSSYRTANVALPGETIKKIPFTYAANQATFSMERMINRDGKKWWPVALRDKEYDNLRRDYEHAVDAALNQDIEGKLDSKAIKAVEVAIDDLENKYKQTIPESERDLYMPAKRQVDKLKQIPRILKDQKVEKSIAAIETYPGTTVYDLMRFMEKYNLQFAVSDADTERELYRDLYVSLAEQRERAGLAVPKAEDAEPK